MSHKSINTTYIGLFGFVVGRWKLPKVQALGGPHPVIVTIRNDEDYIRVLSCSFYPTITGRGVHLRHHPKP